METFKLKTLLLHWLIEWQNWHDDHPKSQDFADTRACYDLAEFIRRDFENIEQILAQADNVLERREQFIEWNEEVKRRIRAPLRKGAT